MNAAVAVRGNNMFLFGGAVEIGTRRWRWSTRARTTARPKWRLVAERVRRQGGASGDGEVSSDDEEAEEAERTEFTARKRDAREKGGRESDDSDEE